MYKAWAAMTKYTRAGFSLHPAAILFTLFFLASHNSLPF